VASRDRRHELPLHYWPKQKECDVLTTKSGHTIHCAAVNNPHDQLAEAFVRPSAIAMSLMYTTMFFGALQSQMPEQMRREIAAAAKERPGNILTGSKGWLPVFVDVDGAEAFRFVPAKAMTDFYIRQLVLNIQDSARARNDPTIASTIAAREWGYQNYLKAVSEGNVAVAFSILALLLWGVSGWAFASSLARRARSGPTNADTAEPDMFRRSHVVRQFLLRTAAVMIAGWAYTVIRDSDALLIDSVRTAFLWGPAGGLSLFATRSRRKRILRDTTEAT